MHTTLMLLHTLLVYASCYVLSLQLLNLIQSFFHLHAREMHATSLNKALCSLLLENVSNVI